MKSVSVAFKEAARRGHAILQRYVYYKRRYWLESTKSYTWEAGWTQLRADQIVSVSTVTAQLDNERLNEFKVSNVTVTLRNEFGEWLPRNPSGKFAPDSAQPLLGYEAFWTKFKVATGFVLADGTTETVDIFTGLAVDFRPMTDQTIQIPVQGLEAILMNTNAEEVSTSVVEENMGTGNGATTVFTTAQPGVGIIEEVSVAGIAKRAGIDYTISNLNEPSLGASVTFAVAPASGTIRGTYKYWQQNQKIEDLVGDLLTEAGIDSADQQVDAVIFKSFINNLFTSDTQADFIGGTSTKLDLYRAPGSIRVDFGQLDQNSTLDDFSSLGAWTQLNTTGGAAISVGASYLEFQNGASVSPAVYRVSTKTRGAWKVRLITPNSGSVFYDFGFMGTDVTPVTSLLPPYTDFSWHIANGYHLAFTVTSSSLSVSLVRVSTYPSTAILGSTSISASASTNYTVSVTRNAEGVMKVYIDDVLKFTATDSTYNRSTRMVISSNGSTLTGTPISIFDYVNDPKADISASWASGTFDAASTPVGFGKMETTHNPNGATLTYYTRTSTDGISWDSWTAIASNNVIVSALKRYLQWKVEIAISDIQTQDPVIDKVTMEYKTTSTLSALANFTGKTVYQAIQEFGRFANYEWGFNPDETFFFRAKSVSTDIDETLDYGVNLAEISDMTQGWDRTFSEVRATYGNYTGVVKADGQNRFDPKARFAFQVLEVDGGDILVAPDTDMATGIAQTFAASVSRPRRRCKARATLMPHVDLSDTVSLTFDTTTPRKKASWGDSVAEYGDADLYHYGAGQQISDGTLFKVIGYRHETNPKNAISEFDLEEVLPQ